MTLDPYILHYNIDKQYGDGTKPKPALVAIPETNGPFFTKEKAYPIIRHEAFVYIIIDDKGNQRKISIDNLAKSVLLSVYSYKENKELAGTMGRFRIEKAP